MTAGQRRSIVLLLVVVGVFDTGDVDGFVAALTDLYPLRATRSADGTIVLSDGASK